MDWLVFIPVAALIGLAFVAPGRRPASLGATILVWLGVLVAFVTVRQFVPDQMMYPNSEAVKRVQGQLKVLRATPKWSDHPILILEGSSVTLFGINGAELRQQLAARGIDVTVLQFAMAGANHYERRHLLKLFWQTLKPTEREKFQRTRVILLSEVFDAYDEDPLYLFGREAYSERTILYCTPANAWAAWQAYSIYRKQPGFTEDSEHPIGWPLLENALLNTFAVGTFSDMRPRGRLRGMGGFFALTEPKPNFDFTATWTAFSESLRDPQSPKNPPPLPQWSHYDSTLQSDFANCFDQTGFYALPLIEAQRLSYQRAFARTRPAGTWMFGPPEESFYSGINQPGDWFDGTHPRESGSVIFTNWLAAQIADRWSELSSQPVTP